jgi:hypothetical protein
MEGSISEFVMRIFTDNKWIYRPQGRIDTNGAREDSSFNTPSTRYNVSKPWNNSPPSDNVPRDPDVLTH